MKMMNAQFLKLTKLFSPIETSTLKYFLQSFTININKVSSVTSVNQKDNISEAAKRQVHSDCKPVTLKEL